MKPERGLHRPSFSAGFEEPCPRFCLQAALSSACCAASPLSPGVRPSRQLLLAHPNSRRGKSEWQCPRWPTCPSRWSKATSGVGMHSRGASGGFRLMLLLLGAEQLPCPSPLASAGPFLSCVINRDLLASCLSPQAFHRLLPKAVTTCSSSLSNGKAARYMQKGKDTRQ